MLMLLSPPETEMQAKTLWMGNDTSPLSAAGRATAIEFAQHSQIKADRVFAPPGEHFTEFAEHVVVGDVETILEFTDRCMGSLTGRSYRETMAEFPRRNWLGWQRSYWTAPPDGESLFDISERVLGALRTKIMPVHGPETVVILASADVLRILIGFLSRIEETDIPKIRIEDTMPYVIHGDLI